jgi:hypothetical protein
MYPARFLAGALAATLLLDTVHAQDRGPLTNQRICGLLADGVSSQEVIRVIMSAKDIDFTLQPAYIDLMMKAGVTDDVIKAMAARENGTKVSVSSDIANDRSAPVPATIGARSSTRVAESGASGPGSHKVPMESEKHKLTYDGGSIPNLKTGTGVKLYLDQNQIHIFKDDVDVLTLPSTAITEISYGQDVHRRVGAAIGLATVSFGIGALMALTKSKKHFIGVTWDDAGNKGGAAFQADKNDYRGVLTGLEGITGRKAVDSDTMTVKN